MISINKDVAIMVLDLMHVHDFHGQTMNWVKMLLFLGLMIVLLCILTME